MKITDHGTIQTLSVKGEAYRGQQSPALLTDATMAKRIAKKDKER
jgi:hypothetical protein